MNITVYTYVIKTTINQNEIEIVAKSVSNEALERIQKAIETLKDTNKGASTEVRTKTVGV